MLVCLFDIDGTLLASGGAGKAALETALREDFGVRTIRHVPYSGRTDRAIVRDLFCLHDIDETPAHLSKVLTGYLARLPDCLRRHQGRVLPGILELLEFLRGRDNVAVGLLTGNVRAGAEAKLGHFGLFEHFAFGGFGDHHFERDDVAREALEAIHRHVGPHVQSDQVWVIGDTPLDVGCARAIGANVAAVATGSHPRAELTTCAPDIVLDDLSDFRTLLKMWKQA
ncbi:MAG: haloacid dehalogenase-like hydrolase [Gemmataceae bacterium]